MTVFHYDWTTHLYYFGRRWGSASYYEHGPSGGVSRIDQYFNTEPGKDRSDFTCNPAGQLRSETRANAAYAWTGSVPVSRPYSVNGQNQYTAAGPASFTYDANGNLTSDGSTNFAYDLTGNNPVAGFLIGAGLDIVEQVVIEGNRLRQRLKTQSG